MCAVSQIRPIISRGGGCHLHIGQHLHEGWGKGHQSSWDPSAWTPIFLNILQYLQEKHIVIYLVNLQTCNSSSKHFPLSQKFITLINKAYIYNVPHTLVRCNPMKSRHLQEAAISMRGRGKVHQSSWDPSSWTPIFFNILKCLQNKSILLEDFHK